jgi:hypothetical protein
MNDMLVAIYDIYADVSVIHKCPLIIAPFMLHLQTMNAV